MGISIPSTARRISSQQYRAIRCIKYIYPDYCRTFHDYFVTHLPSSSLHPDSRSPSGPHHQLPRSASKPHSPSSSGPSPAPLLGTPRDTTVVRIPIRSAKHHFGVSVSRGTRPYNEDAYQAGVIELPAFAKRAPLNLTSRAPASSPLQAYREGQRKQKQLQENGDGDGEGTSAEGASGDPQVFYFGVFDGHGGTDCSEFLTEKLHDYIEEAAQKYELVSSLKGKTEKKKAPEEELKSSPTVAARNVSAAAIEGDKVEVDSENSSLEGSISAPTTSDNVTVRKPSSSTDKISVGAQERASSLQTNLMECWRKTVGGYFRRFQPEGFSPPPSSSMTAVLTHAFLAADLSFVTTQLRLSAASSDPVASDAPINAADIHPSSAPHVSSFKTSKRPFRGGSTASVALISTPTPTPFWHPSSPSTLLTAHVGDTRIILCQTSTGAAIPLTTDHHPSQPSEAARLRRSALTFVTDSFGEERMSGLANTRAFGDMPSKRMGVSAEPEIRRVELSAAQYSFLVLVSDGISGTASDQEIVDIVKEARTPEQGARDVVSFATEVSKEGDNCTCLVVRLGGWERRSGLTRIVGTVLASLKIYPIREWRFEELGLFSFRFLFASNSLPSSIRPSASQ